MDDKEFQEYQKLIPEVYPELEKETPEMQKLMLETAIAMRETEQWEALRKVKE